MFCSTPYRSSRSDVFLGKGILKICSKFTRKHQCRSVISIRLQSNFSEITLQHDCSPVNLPAYFQNTFSLKNLWRAASDLRETAPRSFSVKTFMSLTNPWESSTQYHNIIMILFHSKTFAATPTSRTDMALIVAVEDVKISKYADDYLDQWVALTKWELSVI